MPKSNNQPEQAVKQGESTVPSGGEVAYEVLKSKFIDGINTLGSKGKVATEIVVDVVVGADSSNPSEIAKEVAVTATDGLVSTLTAGAALAKKLPPLRAGLLAFGAGLLAGKGIEKGIDYINDQLIPDLLNQGDMSIEERKQQQNEQSGQTNNPNTTDTTEDYGADGHEDYSPEWPSYEETQHEEAPAQESGAAKPTSWKKVGTLGVSDEDCETGGSSRREEEVQVEIDSEGNPTGNSRTVKTNKNGSQEVTSESNDPTDVDNDGIPDQYDNDISQSSKHSSQDDSKDDAEDMPNPIDDKPGNQKSRFEDIIKQSDPVTNWGPDGKSEGGHSAFADRLLNVDADINWGPEGNQKTAKAELIDALTNVDADINWGPDGEPGGRRGEYTIVNPVIKHLGGFNPRAASIDIGAASMQADTSNLIGNNSDSIQLLAKQNLI